MADINWRGGTAAIGSGLIMLAGGLAELYSKKPNSSTNPNSNDLSPLSSGSIAPPSSSSGVATPTSATPPTRPQPQKTSNDHGTTTQQYSLSDILPQGVKPYGLIGAEVTAAIIAGYLAARFTPSTPGIGGAPATPPTLGRQLKRAGITGGITLATLLTGTEIYNAVTTEKIPNVEKIKQDIATINSATELTKQKAEAAKKLETITAEKQLPDTAQLNSEIAALRSAKPLIEQKKTLEEQIEKTTSGRGIVQTPPYVNTAKTYGAFPLELLAALAVGVYTGTRRGTGRLQKAAIGTLATLATFAALEGARVGLIYWNEPASTKVATADPGVSTPAARKSLGRISTDVELYVTDEQYGTLVVREKDGDKPLRYPTIQSGPTSANPKDFATLLSRLDAHYRAKNPSFKWTSASVLGLMNKLNDPDNKYDLDSLSQNEVTGAITRLNRLETDGKLDKLYDHFGKYD